MTQSNPHIAYSVKDALTILGRTPVVLSSMLSGLPQEWVNQNEGGSSWSPKEIVAHLIFGEETDWIPRAEIFLDPSADRALAPFDMSGHCGLLKSNEMEDLLEMFGLKRKKCLAALGELDLSHEQFELKAIHPSLGSVKLKHHLSAWVVHDLGHIAQISRVMAKLYKSEVGPWSESLTVLNDRPQNSK